MARPELLDRRPGWPATLRLEPLPPEQAGELIAEVTPRLAALVRRDEAVAAWREALDRYERKQIVPLARRVRDRLTTLRETPS
jgi:hypothetical protein